MCKKIISTSIITIHARNPRNQMARLAKMRRVVGSLVYATRLMNSANRQTTLFAAIYFYPRFYLEHHGMFDICSMGPYHARIFFPPVPVMF